MMKKLKVLAVNAFIVVVIWGSITLGLAYSLGVQGIGPLAGKVPGNGIHPLEGAVYIAGEACTIDAPMDRSAKNIRETAEQCARLHAEWQESLGWEYGDE